MSLICNIFVSILASLIVSVPFLLLVRNEIAYRNQGKIADAIYLYQLDCLVIDAEPEVDFDDMENYDRTMFRLLDFGYKHILPEEKYELVRPYIGLEVKNYGQSRTEKDRPTKTD